MPVHVGFSDYFTNTKGINGARSTRLSAGCVRGARKSAPHVSFAHAWRTRAGHANYFSSTRVPRTFWLLSVLKKFGTRRSISSKYEDNAGVLCCTL